MYSVLCAPRIYSIPGKTISKFNIQLDSVPYFWNSTDISGLLVWQHKSKVVDARPKDGIRWVSA